MFKFSPSNFRVVVAFIFKSDANTTGSNFLELLSHHKEEAKEIEQNASAELVVTTENGLMHRSD